MHSDVVLQSLISDVFWLILLAVAVLVFRHEIRNLLNSLGSFKVAGASFELKDSRTTIENYVILTNIMIEVLTQRDSAIKIGSLLSDLSVGQLASFAIKYSKDVPDDAKQIELLKNVALIVDQRGDAESAIVFFDSLLKQHPNNLDLLALKANALGGTGASHNLLEAEGIQNDLVNTRPMNALYRFNRAITKARLKKFEDACSDLGTALDLGYKNFPRNVLDWPEFRPLRDLSGYQELTAKVKALSPAN